MREAERKQALAHAAGAIAFVGKVCEVLSEHIANDRLHIPIQKVLTEADARLKRRAPRRRAREVTADLEEPRKE